MKDYGVWVTCPDGFNGWSMAQGKRWRGTREQAEAIAARGRERFPDTTYEVHELISPVWGGVERPETSVS